MYHSLQCSLEENFLSVCYLHLSLVNFHILEALVMGFLVEEVEVHWKQVCLVLLEG